MMIIDELTWAEEQVPAGTVLWAFSDRVHRQKTQFLTSVVEQVDWENEEVTLHVIGGYFN